MEPPSPYTISILSDSKGSLPAARLAEIAQIALADQRMPAGELSLRLTTDTGIRALNHQFRKVDAATDVLTFPAAESPLQGPERPLGDIAISLDAAHRQAEFRGIPIEDELGHLLIHGILHLAGYGDETDEERVPMLRQMARIGTLCGLAPVTDWHTLEEVPAIR